MHVLKVIKPIVVTRKQLFCGDNISTGITCLDTAFCAPCVRQGPLAEFARGGVMPRLTKITTLTGKKTADVSLDDENPPASFSTEECTEVSVLIQAHATQAYPSELSRFVQQAVRDLIRDMRW